MEPNRDALKVVTIAAVLLLICYVAAYLATVKAVSLPWRIGIGPWGRIAQYSVGGRAAEVFFYPANAVDRRIRQHHWLDE
jgi:hypothetical protein